MKKLSLSFSASVVVLLWGSAPAAAWDCIPGKLITTSEVSIQVYVEHNGELVPLEGSEVELAGRRGGRPTLAKTDAKGYMRFSGVAPGRYELRMTVSGFGPIYQPLRVVEPGSAPPRMLAVGLRVVQSCSPSCAVVAPREGLTKAPACLADKFFTPKKRP